MSRLAVYEVSNIENFVCDWVRKTRRFLHKVTDLAMSALKSAIGFLGYPHIRLLPSGDVTHYCILVKPTEKVEIKCLLVS